jgi:hypothetical protein
LKIRHDNCEWNEEERTWGEEGDDDDSTHSVSTLKVQDRERVSRHNTEYNGK